MPISGYNFRKRLLVSTNNCGAETNPVIFVTLGDADIDFTQLLATGYDIRPVASDGVTPLTFCRVAYVNTVAQRYVTLAIIIPATLGSGSYSLNIDYGNSSATEASSLTGTLAKPVPPPNSGNTVASTPPSNSGIACWHFDDATLDSTHSAVDSIGGNSMTFPNGVGRTGSDIMSVGGTGVKFTGNGVTCDGVSQYGLTTNTLSPSANNDGWTISMWLTPLAWRGDGLNWFLTSTGLFFYIDTRGGTGVGQARIGGSQYPSSFLYSPQLNVPFHLVVRQVNGVGVYYFINGVLDGLTTNTISSINTHFYIGVGNGAPTNFTNIAMDELMFDGVPWSNEQVASAYRCSLNNFIPKQAVDKLVNHGEVLSPLSATVKPKYNAAGWPHVASGSLPEWFDVHNTGGRLIYGYCSAADPSVYANWTYVNSIGNGNGGVSTLLEQIQWIYDPIYDYYHLLSSDNYGTGNLWYTRTRDFVTFTTPTIILANNGLSGWTGWEDSAIVQKSDGSFVIWIAGNNTARSNWTFAQFTVPSAALWTSLTYGSQPLNTLITGPQNCPEAYSDSTGTYLFMTSDLCGPPVLFKTTDFTNYMQTSLPFSFKRNLPNEYTNISDTAYSFDGTTSYIWEFIGDNGGAGDGAVGLYTFVGTLSQLFNDGTEAAVSGNPTVGVAA